MTTTPDSDQAARWARREALLNLLSRVQRGKTLTPAEGNQLRADVEAEMAVANDAREVADQLRAQRDQAREQLAADPLLRMLDSPVVGVAALGAAAHEHAARMVREANERAEQAQQTARDARRGEAEAVRRAEATGRAYDAARKRAARYAERLLIHRAAAERNRNAWRNARKRAARLSAEVTRRAPLNGEHAERAIRAEGDAARARLVLRTHKRALLTILGMDPLRDWDDISNAVRGTVKARQAAEATLTAERLAQQRRVETTITAIRHAGLCADCEINLRAAIEAALGDPQPATEPDPCAHGCRQAADEHTRLSQEIDAEPECADPQGCHRVVPCNPGCAVTRQALADAMTKAQQPAEPLLRGNLPPLVISIDLSGAALADAIRRAARFGGGPR